MFADFRAGWQIVGLVNGRRELTSPKNPSWRGYVIKVATIGNTFDVNVTQDIYAMLLDQVPYEFAGRFEDRSGHLTLISERIKPLDQPTPRRDGPEAGPTPRRNS